MFVTEDAADACHIALDLVAIADPGTAVVFQQVRAAAPSNIGFERLAPLSLKGFSNPMDAYRIHR